MSVLITGGGGLLGSTIAAELSRDDRSVVATTHSESETSITGEVVYEKLDITDFEAVHQVIKRSRPDVVINCAAKTDVDRCERDPETALAVNATGAAEVAKAADSVNADICHISTDYVFGSDGSPHDPDDEHSPMQVYGRTKSVGERHVGATHSDPLIVRVSFLYGRNAATDEREGIVPWILDRSATGSVQLYTDQFISPTFVGHASMTIQRLIDTGATGVFHANNRGCVTPFEIGEFIISESGRNAETLVRSTRAGSETEAPRPARSCLATEKTGRVLSRPQPDWQEGVLEYLDDI